MQKGEVSLGGYVKFSILFCSTIQMKSLLSCLFPKTKLKKARGVLPKKFLFKERGSCNAEYP